MIVQDSQSHAIPVVYPNGEPSVVAMKRTEEGGVKAKLNSDPPASTSHSNSAKEKKEALVLAPDGLQFVGELRPRR